MKTGIWTKSVFKKLLQLAQTVYYGRAYEDENKKQKKKKQKNKKKQVID